MAEKTGIEWCDHTFNPWIGCTKVAPGCTHCYAEELMDTRYGKVRWGPNGTRVKTSESYWRQPLKWNREAEAAGERRRVFCASLADVFEEWDGPILNAQGERLSRDPETGRHTLQGCPDTWTTMADLRRDLFTMIDQTPLLDWLLLTKRPENVRGMWPQFSGTQVQDFGRVDFRPNVWIGESVSDQATADRCIMPLLECGDLCPITFLSVEPLLGPVDISKYLKMVRVFWNDGAIVCKPAIDWVIIGGESGPKARPCNLEWIRSIVRQCEEAGVSCFVKQLGSYCRNTVNPLDGEISSRIHLKDSHGGDMAEWAEDLRVREWPKAGMVTA